MNRSRAALAAALLVTVLGCHEEDASLAPSRLFAIDIATGTIASFAEKDPPPGTSLAGRLVTGVPAIGYSLAYDSRADRLFVAADGTILVLEGASTASGPVHPARTISPSGVRLSYPYFIAYDAARDTVYLAGHVPSSGMYSNAARMVGFRGASTASGARAPDLSIDFPIPARALALDPGRSIVYLGVPGGAIGWSFDAAGALTPARAVPLPFEPSGLSVDPGRDRLYAASVFDGVVAADAANAASGAPIARLAVSQAQFVTVDPAADRLYVGAYDTAYLVNAASTLGAGAQARAVAGLAPRGSSIAGFAFP